MIVFDLFEDANKKPQDASEGIEEDSTNFRAYRVPEINRSLPGVSTAAQKTTQFMNLKQTKPYVKQLIPSPTGHLQVSVDSQMVGQQDGGALIRGNTIDTSGRRAYRKPWAITIDQDGNIVSQDLGRLNNDELAAVEYNLVTRNRLLQPNQIARAVAEARVLAEKQNNKNNKNPTGAVKDPLLVYHGKEPKVRRVLARAYKETPGAKNDVEAIVGHIANVDEINQDQQNQMQDQQRQIAALTKKLIQSQENYNKQERRFQQLNDKIIQQGGQPTAQDIQAAQAAKNLEQSAVSENDQASRPIPAKSVIQGYTVFWNPQTRTAAITMGGHDAEAALAQVRIGTPVYKNFVNAVTRAIDQLDDELMPGMTEARSPEQFVKDITKAAKKRHQFQVGDWVTIDPNETAGWATSGMIGRIVDILPDGRASVNVNPGGGARGVQKKLTNIDADFAIKAGGTHTTVPVNMLELLPVSLDESGMAEQVLRGPLARDSRREQVAPSERDQVRRELWKYVGSLDQEGTSNRAHAMAHQCPTWGRLYHQFHGDVSQLLSKAPTEQLAQALQEIQSQFQGVAEGSQHNVGDIVNYSTKLGGFKRSYIGGQGKITKKTATHYTIDGREMPHSHVKSRAKGAAEGLAESAGPGEYYIWTVHFADPEKNPPRRCRVWSDEFAIEIPRIKQFYAKKGLKVVDVDTDTGLHSDYTESASVPEAKRSRPWGREAFFKNLERQKEQDRRDRTGLTGLDYTDVQRQLKGIGDRMADKPTRVSEVAGYLAQEPKPLTYAQRIRRLAAQYQNKPTMLGTLAREKGTDSDEQIAFDYLRTRKLRPEPGEKSSHVNWNDVVRGISIQPTLGGQDLLNAAVAQLKKMGYGTTPDTRELMNSVLNASPAIHQQIQAAYDRKIAQSRDLAENSDHEAVEQAIARRIMVGHKDLLLQYGPQRVMQAVEAVADDVGPTDEIGTSDVSGWVHQVERILGAVDQQLDEKWSEKYKRSIDCSHPKGFSQKAHCAGRKK